MRGLSLAAALLAATGLAFLGCRTARPGGQGDAASIDNADPARVELVAFDEPESVQQPPLVLPAKDEADRTTDEAADSSDDQPADDQVADGAETVPAVADETADAGLPVEPPTLVMVADSVRVNFPLIREAIAGRTVASGEALAAEGAFDHRLDGYSESQPLDFYENYRHELGLKRNTYWGGQTFAGYRTGRGQFEPWYLERETNEGGEFKAGFVAPLSQDRWIDPNRAELWRAQLERGRVEPVIRARVIGSVRDGSAAYWQWVAAGANYRVADDVLRLGLDRAGLLARQVEEGEKAQIDLVDNRRIIVSRQAKLIDAGRKLAQSAVKLSLFFRDGAGRPLVLPPEAATVEFPPAPDPAAWGDFAAVGFARANRPELEEFRIVQRQLGVALRQACNEILPTIDAGLLTAQDFGEPTSSKRDKSEFELEASVLLSVPLERRKARGKVRQLRGKLAQVRAKTQFAADKIAAESQAAHAALTAAAARVEQTSEGVVLAERIRVAEGRLYAEGQSTLLALNLRELQVADARTENIAAQLDYHVALADYAAALGLESSDQLEPNTEL